MVCWKYSGLVLIRACRLILLCYDETFTPARYNIDGSNPLLGMDLCPNISFLCLHGNYSNGRANPHPSQHPAQTSATDDKEPRLQTSASGTEMILDR